MEFIKYSKDKQKLRELVEQDDGFKVLDRDAALVISECTNSGFQVEEEMEVFDMCQALREIREEAAEIGRQEGREEGREETLVELVRKKLLAPDTAAQLLQISEEELNRLVNLT